jgi:hypothetical protein
LFTPFLFYIFIRTHIDPKRWPPVLEAGGQTANTLHQLLLQTGATEAMLILKQGFRKSGAAYTRKAVLV